MAENKTASKMASTHILLFTISLHPFNRFSSDFHQNLEIYFQLIGICYNFNVAENKMASKMASTKIFVSTISLQSFNRFSSNFTNRFSSNNLEMYFQFIGISYNFNLLENKLGVQNGVHLDICIYNISSTVQPISQHFHQNTLKYISDLYE